MSGTACKSPHRRSAADEESPFPYSSFQITIKEKILRLYSLRGQGKISLQKFWNTLTLIHFTTTLLIKNIHK
jgi:hypothetical protein